MFLFPWNWDNFFLRCRNNTIYRTTLMDELSNVGNTITSLKQNDLLNVILYGQKNFDSNNSQSMIGTKTLIGIAIKVYSPQPSNLSTNHFFELLTILDNPVYKFFRKLFYSFILLLFIISVYEETWSVYFCIIWFHIVIKFVLLVVYC